MLDAAAGTQLNHLLVVAVSTCAGNAKRRQACRRSWFQYKTSENSSLNQAQRDAVQLSFIASEGAEELSLEQALTFLAWLENQPGHYDYFMHADDDSLLRLDLLVPYLEQAPRERFYWGYIWNDGSARHTDVIRNPSNKSHMPADQYPLDYYPPFASGCGFVLSRDLVRALLKQELPDYRLLDPPFGIHLCGRERCVLEEPVTPVHDDRVRPYRPLPMFRPDTVVQHYMRPEEMQPFYQQALQHAQHGRHQECTSSSSGAEAGSSAEMLYEQLVHMGLLRR